MERKRILLIFGLLLSLLLLVVLFARLDWSAFFKVLEVVDLKWVIAAGGLVIAGIMGRALRWNLIAGVSLRQYGHFWRALNLGYLGNFIYPARAGELLRMAIIHRFGQLPPGQAVVSAVVDRVADGVMLCIFTIFVLMTHGAKVFGILSLISFGCVFIVAGLVVVGFVMWGHRWQPFVTRWVEHWPARLNQRVPYWYMQAFEGVKNLRQLRRLLILGILNLQIFLLDYGAMWLLMSAFGWSLPFHAAITVGVFLEAGTSLPSAPGYLGIYQVACILALKIYGLSEPSALAYSFVLQLLTLIVIVIQSSSAVLRYGFRLSAAIKTVGKGI
jgi:uncharacterized protein (TIRG00374 family)